MKQQKLRDFTEAEQSVWCKLFNGLDFCRDSQAHPIFCEGVELLGLKGNEFPDLAEINRRLKKLTGWQGIPVEGLEENDSFFEGLKNRQFPIGNFIRDAQDISYTPAPDIFHDLYGHLPFLANRDYADFCERFGRMALKYKDSEECMERFGRLFWFGVEFPLVKTNFGIRIFGGGILSSVGESNYSLSPIPKVLPFDCRTICDKPYRIDKMQDEIFILDNPEQLYDCLEEFEECVLESCGTELALV